MRRDAGTPPKEKKKSFKLIFAGFCRQKIEARLYFLVSHSMTDKHNAWLSCHVCVLESSESANVIPKTHNKKH